MLTSSSLPLKWHGGKQYLATKIVELIPTHMHYVEAFFGGGAVMFAKPSEMVEGHSEVAVHFTETGAEIAWRLC